MRRLTIGIPAYNEEHNMPHFLRSLEEQRCNGFEISEVIVSDDSSDATPEIVSRFAKRSPLNVRLIHHEDRRGAAAAWNEILQEATGDMIALYDADTIPHPSCTEQLVSGLRGSVGLCASNSQPAQQLNIPSRASAFISNWLRSVRLAELSQYTAMGRALAIDSRAARFQIPSDIIAIDLFLQCKVLEAGLDVAYNDNAVVYFQPASTMQDLVSQVVRATNGHNQLNEYISRLGIGLPMRTALRHTIRNGLADPVGVLSVAAAHLLIPYYRSKLEQTDSAKWHTAQSSKAIDYQQLKARF